MDEIPTIPKQLIDWLSDRIPERHPTLDKSDREVWFNAGKRNVVNFLVDKYNEQNQNILQTNL
jgi:hypothetical protein